MGIRWNQRPKRDSTTPSKNQRYLMIGQAGRTTNSSTNRNTAHRLGSPLLHEAEAARQRSLAIKGQIGRFDGARVRRRAAATAAAAAAAVDAGGAVQTALPREFQTTVSRTGHAGHAPPPRQRSAVNRSQRSTSSTSRLAGFFLLIVLNYWEGPWGCDFTTSSWGFSFSSRFNHSTSSYLCHHLRVSL